MRTHLFDGTLLYHLGLFMFNLSIRIGKNAVWTGVALPTLKPPVLSV